MKIVCTVENLKTAALISERFTGKHITLPILSHLLCKADEKRILIIATNLEIGVEYTLSGRVQKSGSVTIPARAVAQLLQSLSEDTLTLEGRQQQVIFYTPSSEITILGLNPSDFPNLPIIKKEHSLNISAAQLIEALERVLSAAATTDLKPELAGVLLSVREDKIVLVATDSFRLAEVTFNYKPGERNVTEWIIPVRAAQEIMRIVPKDMDKEVRVSAGERQILFEWEEVKILSRLIDGAYPPYQSIIPETYETTLVTKRDELIKKIRLAAVFSSRLNDVTLRYSPTSLEVSTANAETGSTTSRLPAKGRGVSGTAVFNYRYLTDGIDGAGGEHVVLNLNGVSGPTLIQNPADTSYRYLVMPIRSV